MKSISQHPISPILTKLLVPDLSIIIPVYNDSQAFGHLATQIENQKGLTLEVIVVGGGTKQEISELKKICKRSRFVLLLSQPGRGKQMNAGRESASSKHLLFLHADSAFSSRFQLHDALRSLESREQKEPRVAGHFALTFETQEEEMKFGLGFLERKSALNRKNTTNGDQGLLLSAAFFDNIGRFSEELPFLEDQIIAENIRASGQIFTLPHRLRTSARRFEREGFLRRYYLMMIIMGAYYTKTDEFFRVAPNLYPNQDDTIRLDMPPFFEAIEKVQNEIGRARSIKMWKGLGVFARENIWQIFLLGDYIVWPTSSKNRLLASYDKTLNREAKWLENFLGLSAFITITKASPLLFRSAHWLSESLFDRLHQSTDIEV